MDSIAAHNEQISAPTSLGKKAKMVNRHHAPLLYRMVPDLLQSIAWLPGYIALRLFARYRIIGREHLSGIRDGMILAANHVDEIDPIVLRGILPLIGRQTPLFYVARKSDVYNWKGWRSVVYTNLFFRSWGAYPAVSGSKSYAKALKEIVPLCSGRNTVSIFPVGLSKDSYSDDTVKVHGGVGYLALHSNLPVVPVSIAGTKNITWKKFFGRKHSIRVYVGKPISFERKTKPTVDDCKQCANEVWHTIQQGFYYTQLNPTKKTGHEGKLC